MVLVTNKFPKFAIFIYRSVVLQIIAKIASIRKFLFPEMEDSLCSCDLHREESSSNSSRLSLVPIQEKLKEAWLVISRKKDKSSDDENSSDDVPSVNTEHNFLEEEEEPSQRRSFVRPKLETVIEISNESNEDEEEKTANRTGEKCCTIS